MSVLIEPDRIQAIGTEKLRVLRPLKIHAGPVDKEEEKGPYIGVAVDTETTGLNWRTGHVIELALRRFRYNGSGKITHVDRAYEWRQDPGEPLTSDVSRLTGLTDADLVGQEINVGAAARLLGSASFVVAHNSAFDRPWLESALDEIQDLAWVCSMSQIDWRGRGFDGRALGYLLMQYGFYHCGHRASADVDALIQLLQHEDGSGRTALAELISTGSKTSWIVRAKGAHFGSKDLLRSRGYRWDGADERKVWWREVPDVELAAEQDWLTAHIYAAQARPSAPGPELERITPRSRFR